jgi:ATP-dependent DNA helicase RecG
VPSSDIERALAGPPAELGQLLLTATEDQWFERKSSRIEPRRLGEALVAFANADGGCIVVGLGGGKVKGTRQDLRRRNELMQAALTFTEPAVRAKPTLQACINDSGEEDELLVFDVVPSSTVHATSKDEVFLRVGDESRRLTFSQRRELLYDKRQAAYEVELTPLTLGNVDPELLADYATGLGHPDPIRLLRARGLVDGERLTIAGCLLFAHSPTQVLPNAHIRVSRFAGTDRALGARQNLVRDDRFEGPIPQALNAAQERIDELQPRRRALGPGGRFVDVALVPQDAWLEGLVNAVVHRSYSLGGDHIHVDIFDDRIEIESPGRFPGLVDLTHPLTATRFARNPRIARVCADLRLGQEFGEGIRRMFEEMRLAGLADPMYHQTSGSVQLTLSGEHVERRLEERLPAETRSIVAALRTSGQLSTGEVAELIGLARPTTIRRLQMLRQAGVIEWVGKSSSDPRAFWRISR